MSTVHKAKGRERARVKIADDFTLPKDSGRLDVTGREIGCITQALDAGDLVRGSRSLAMVHKPFGHARNRGLLPGCPACQRLMDRLNIIDTYGGG